MDYSYDRSQGWGESLVTSRTPWPHQREVIPLAVQSKTYALFWEMGVGKTFTSIQVLRHWYSAAGRVLKTLIFGPPIVVENWKREIDEFSKFGDQTFALQGSLAMRQKVFRKLTSIDPNRVFITNYQALVNVDFVDMLLAWGPECIIFDESHRLKDPRAGQSKSSKKLAELASHKLILSGTPVLNNELDLWHQYYLLDGGEALGKNYFVYQRTFFKDKNAGMPSQRHFPKWVPIPGMTDTIKSRVAHMTSVVKKEECLSLPPLVRQVRYVSMGAEQKKAYDSLSKDFVAFIGSKACTAELTVVKAVRMTQVASGFMPIKDDDESEVHEFKDNPKIKALEELLDEIGGAHKVIIWAVYHQNYKAIKELLLKRSTRFVEVHGKIPSSQKQKAIDDFQNDPGVKVFIGHPLSAGIGINLIAAPYAIFYSRTFSLEQSLQAESRNYRGGSEIHKSVTRIDLVTKGTIEEEVVSALVAKEDVLEKILKGIKGVHNDRKLSKAVSRSARA